MASSHLSGYAGVRHDGHNPPLREDHAATQKNMPDHQTEHREALQAMIRWSIQEIRRIAIRLAQRRIKPAHVIAGSLWRRAHQAVVRSAHRKHELQL
jgi:hypothetical protein